MIVTLYRGAKQPVPISADDFTWPELVEGLRDLVSRETGAEPEAREDTQKEALLAWSPVRLSKPYRLLANVEAVTALVIDVDNADVDTIADAIVRLRIAAIVYGSPRDHVEGLRRVRVVSPITREIKPEECRASRLRFAELLEVQPRCGVEEACSAEKIFFAGRMHDAYYTELGLEPEREFAVNDGAAVDVDALLAAPLEFAWDEQPERAPRSSGEIVAATDDTIGAIIGAHDCFKGRRHDLSGAVAGTLRKMGLSASRGEALGRAWLREKWSEHGPWFMGAWSTGADAVSGRTALESIVGAEPAEALARAFAPTTAPKPVPDSQIANDEELRGFPVVPFDTDRKGDARPTISNVELLLASTIGGKIRYDEHRRRIAVAGVSPQIMDLPDGPWTDTHTIEVQAFCETFGLRLDKGKVSDAVKRHARKHRFNPALDWAIQCGQRWDGQSRIDRAMAAYWRAEGGAAATAGRIFFLSMAARLLEPGCKVHTVLILQSDTQYLAKSASLEALVPVREWFSDSPLPIGDKDGSLNHIGKVVWELGEGASTSKRDAETLKQFFSSSVETVRGPYQEFAEDVARTCVFAITTNRRDLLKDPTGERRFMTVRVGDTIDVEGIARDREQLIGEAVVRVLRDEQWWLTKEEVSILAEANESISDRADRDDYLVDRLTAWIDARQDPEAPITWKEIGAAMLVDELDQRTQRRLIAAFAQLGWRAGERVHVAGVRVRAFVRG